ncbi:uncharacterized protein TNCV_1613971 [Trichonephila clavipes]|nr:uncharacterized protein TNCV_1613971 [Trichonephila clavipes]
MSAPAVTGNFSPDHNSKCMSSMSRSQAVWLQVFPWPPSNKHMTITGTKAEPSFIRKTNTSPMSFRLTPMAWSQQNTCYRAPGSELSLK